MAAGSAEGPGCFDSYLFKKLPHDFMDQLIIYLVASHISVSIFLKPTFS